MTQIESTGVLIVGAGPVGLAAAIELSRRNVAVRIIEVRSAPSTYSKAIGINARSLDLLEPSGVTERLLQLGHRIPGIDFQHPDGKLVQYRVRKGAASL